MKVFIDLYIGCLTLGVLCLFSGKLLFEDKKRIKIIKSIISILIVALISSILNIYAIDIITNVIKIILTYTLLCVYYFIYYKSNIPKSITGGFVTYLCIFISEAIVALILSVLMEFLNYESMELLKNTMFINCVIYTISYLLLRINEKKFIDLIKNSDFNKKITSFLSILIVFTIALLGFKIPLSEWNFNVDFIVTMLTLLSFCVIAFFILKQKSVIKNTKSMYQQLVEYSDVTNKLLEDYRVVSHEHKNQLSIIRGMLDGENQELLEYVDELLEKRNVIKYQWIGELNRLPLSGLKGLINYKLMEMEKAKINISITISNDLSKVKLNKLSSKQKDNLYSIMGIYLDNAVQAAQISEKKEISLEMYKEKKSIVIVLANTYKGEIDLDKLDDYGYTTKGKKHGVGLSIVKNIIEKDNLFYQKRMLFQEYYVQELRIDLNKVK